MARRARHTILETRTSRLKLTVRRKPYNGPSLARGIVLLYRRNRTNGTWVLKASDGHGKYWTKRIAEADDFDASDGKTVLAFFEAQDIAKQLARGGGTEADSTAPITVDRALAEYRADLLSRDAQTANADWPRVHLTPVLLSKPVQLLASKELNTWKLGLLEKIAPASVNRLCNCICAALELAAQHDPRIQNRDAWRVGLGGLPDARTARNVVRPDSVVHAFVARAYRHDPALGLLADVLAVTGARPVQVARLRVEDLHAHATRPKLMMPKSGKGGGRNRSAKKAERYSVPITVALSKKLKAASAAHAPDSLLLRQSNGRPWGENPGNLYRKAVRKVLTAIGEDPAEVTMYFLRHSNIVRMLLRNIPIRLIASLHNTSVQQIEKNYSAHITEHSSDALSRTGLLSDAPVASNVVTLVR